jgi:hypothetical protein
MKAVKRVLVIDPDTGERSVRLEFDTTQPWDEATVALFSQWLDEKGVDARLRHARELLAEIADTPEHDRAKEVLNRGQAVHPNQLAAENAWMEFCALYEHAKRRIAGQQKKKASSAGGRIRAAAIRSDPFEGLDARDARIVATAKRLLKSGEERRRIAGIIALEFDLTPTTIRRILKQTNMR